MPAFIKTFLFCLILSLGFLGYQYFGHSGYSPDLSVKDNPIFTVQKTPKNYETAPSQTIEETENLKEINPKETLKEKPNLKKEMYIHTSYFYSEAGTLVPIKRETNIKDNLKGSITMLLKGPTIQESKRGIYSEIPANVDLISITRNKNSIIVNLSGNFGTGGGSESIDNRMKQLTKTVKTIEPKSKIYLYIEGKKVEYLGGDGVYIKQPL